MKFLLTSAGITNEHITQALVKLAGKPAEEISFLFIPTAANLEAGSKEWLAENLIEFQKQNFKTVVTVDIAAAPLQFWKDRFDDADVICFGGGNEQYLAKVFNDVGMKDFLKDNLKDKVYVGISAGSMVAGQFISHELMALVYPEEINPELAKPLSFVDFCFIPHLNSDWYTHVRKETLEGLKGRLEKLTYATDDDTALAVVEGLVEVIGKGEWWISNI